MRRALQYKRYGGFQPSRSTLDSLLTLMLSDAGDEARVSIVARQGISAVKAATLDDLFAEIEQVPTGPIKKLEISVTSGDSANTYAPYEERTNSSVDFSATGTEISVSGQSETWVHGRFIEIVDRLKQTRPRPVVPPIYLSSAWVMITFGLTLPSIFIHGHAKAVLSGIAVILIACVGPTWLWSSRRWRTMLDFSAAAKKGWLNPDRILAILGILAGLAAIAVALWTWKNPVK